MVKSKDEVRDDDDVCSRQFILVLVIARSIDR
jgi:hypothetical protein